MHHELLWVQFPTTFTKMIDQWRIENNNKFSSKEIFREEFLKFIDCEVMSRFQKAMDETFRHNRESHEDALKQMRQEQKDLWYSLQDNTKALTELARLVTAQTIIKLKKKSK